jgi:hypothetical protein
MLRDYSPKCGFVFPQGFYPKQEEHLQVFESHGDHFKTFVLVGDVVSTFYFRRNNCNKI